MKRFLSIFSLIFMVMLTSPVVDAKKFGGGGSAGRSFKTAPAPTKSPAGAQNDASKSQTQPNTAPKSDSKKGLLGGILGGVLAGGLFAALFSGLGGGSSFLGLFAFIAVAVGLFVLFKKRTGARSQQNSSASSTGFAQKSSASSASGFADATPAYAAAAAGAAAQPQPQQAPQPSAAQFSQQATAEATQASSAASSAGFAQGGFATAEPEVPHNLPASFDADAFVNGAREHYRILQKAWDNNQFETIKEYVSSELYTFLVAERAKSSAQQTSEVLFVDAQIVRADYDDKVAQISLQFSGRYRDITMQEESAIADLWHLERKLGEPNAPWLIIGIENS